MLRKLLPFCFLCAAFACAQQPGPPPGITYQPPDPNPPRQPDPAPAADTPATPAHQLAGDERRQVLAGIVNHLKQSYVLPDMAKLLVESLELHQKQGDYDTIADGALFAARLTADLQGVSHDRHLRVEYSPAKLPPEEGGPGAEEEQQYRNELARTNCGFQRAEILPGNIGYVQVNYFGAPDVCGVTAASAMKFVAHADALIFDLRQNHGGDPAMVAILASYLFDRPTHLDDLYSRHDNKTTQYWATPEKVADRLSTQPVYVLTSRFSFSGAEQFCYDLRNLKRATLIGEKTGGASHPTRNRRIDDHFLIAVPEYRYINSVTKTDWEVEGIHPDIPAAPWNALMVAQKLALIHLHRTDVQQAIFPTTASR